MFSHEGNVWKFPQYASLSINRCCTLNALMALSKNVTQRNNTEGHLLLPYFLFTLIEINVHVYVNDFWLSLGRNVWLCLFGMYQLFSTHWSSYLMTYKESAKKESASQWDFFLPFISFHLLFVLLLTLFKQNIYFLHTLLPIPMLISREF